MIHKATGNLRAIQISLGQTKIENMVRYIEEALEIVSVRRFEICRRTGDAIRA